MRGTGTKRKAQLISLPRYSDVSKYFHVGNNIIPVEEEAKHLSRVEGGFRAHNVGNVGDGRKDSMKKNTIGRDNQLQAKDILVGQSLSWSDCWLKSTYYRHCAPCTAFTPFHTIDITARLKVGHNAPQVPKLARHATGKGILYNAPARPFSAMRQPASNWPPSEQARASHMLRPAD
jgi:hypothetical protein